MMEGKEKKESLYKYSLICFECECNLTLLHNKACGVGILFIVTPVLVHTSAAEIHVIGLQRVY